MHLLLTDLIGRTKTLLRSSMNIFICETTPLACTGSFGTMNMAIVLGSLLRVIH
ncbi:uncharacterized protein METZ01_LOCUS391517 [marine metagenome]|uniref:Uncharacterized protein n=1 Tax=marine metagenome TaxID=408172 RepID=A0A382UWM4_9ZZZZ